MILSTNQSTIQSRSSLRSSQRSCLRSYLRKYSKKKIISDYFRKAHFFERFSLIHSQKKIVEYFRGPLRGSLRGSHRGGAPCARGRGWCVEPRAPQLGRPERLGAVPGQEKPEWPQGSPSEIKRQGPGNPCEPLEIRAGPSAAHGPLKNSRGVPADPDKLQEFMKPPTLLALSKCNN